MKLTPKNWQQFQHYKDRSPPWIKLHKGLLDDRVYQRLPDASRALAPCLWLLASEDDGGSFDGSVEEIAFRVRQSERWVRDALKPLIDNGFFIVERNNEQDASGVLAERLRDACLETEAEKSIEANASHPSKLGERMFETFWKAYPRKVGKDAARKAFDKRKPDDVLVQSFIRAIELQSRSEAWRKDGGQFIPHPATWLNEGRWMDDGIVSPVAQPVELWQAPPPMTEAEKQSANEARIRALSAVKRVVA